MEIGNRKECLRVREAGASAAGRGQRPYASFPDVIPKRGMGATPSFPMRSIKNENQGAKRHLIVAEHIKTRMAC